jgi:hypothetical protein
LLQKIPAKLPELGNGIYAYGFQGLAHPLANSRQFFDWQGNEEVIHFILLNYAHAIRLVGVGTDFCQEFYGRNTN